MHPNDRKYQNIKFARVPKLSSRLNIASVNYYNVSCFFEWGGGEGAVDEMLFSLWVIKFFKRKL